MYRAEADLDEGAAAAAAAADRAYVLPPEFKGHTKISPAALGTYDSSTSWCIGRLRFAYPLSGCALVAVVSRFRFMRMEAEPWNIIYGNAMDVHDCG